MRAAVVCMVMALGCMGAWSRGVCGEGVLCLDQLKPAIPEEVPGSRVPTWMHAGGVAMHAYENKTGGADALESFNANLFYLDFDMDGFAKSGDLIWEVKIDILKPEPHRALRAIAWVHPDTAQVHFLCAPWMQGLSASVSPDRDPEPETEGQTPEDPCNGSVR